MPKVLESFDRLGRGADLVLVEGAGSPAEVNLREDDIANMGFAEAADLPVVLVGDVDRGGFIASVVGTWELLRPSERARLEGYIVNRFRGDPALFGGAIEAIGARTGLACLGIVPYAPEALRLPAEDSVALDDDGPAATGRAIQIAVPRLPRIANFDDLDPLRLEPDVALAMVPPGSPIPGDADLVILPGSKATLADLAACRAEGWDIDLAAHVRRGGWVLGLCGGYQMLGTHIADPGGIEGLACEAPGLGHLDVATTLAPDKRLVAVAGHDRATGEAVAGYEMHIGVTSGPGTAAPMLDLAGRPDGAGAGRVMGCYLHGLFAADGFRHAFLARLRARQRSTLAYGASIDSALDALADRIEAALDLEGLYAIARRGSAAA
jgi:adenosylcobyric acid synthase